MFTSAVFALLPTLLHVTPDNVLVMLCHGNRPFLQGVLHPVAAGIETVPLWGLVLKCFSPFGILVKTYGKEKTAIKERTAIRGN